MTESDRRALVEYYKRGAMDSEVRTLAVGGFGGVPVSDVIVRHLEKKRHNWPLQKFSTTYKTIRDTNKIFFAKSDASVEFVEEGAAYTESAPKIHGHEMELFKIGGLCLATEELVQDSGIDIEQLLGDSFGRSLSIKLEQMFIDGNGDKKPRGFLLDAQTVGAAGSTVAYGDLAKLFKALDESMLPYAVWLVNRDTFALLSGLSDSSGNRCLIPDTTGETAGYIFGKPVYITFLPSKKPIALGDFSQYVTVEQPAFIRRLEEKFRDSGNVGFIYRQRINGRLSDSNSIFALELGA
ncbi:MAG: phage major capsid protein [Treponema sp.]|jgi:HK97 family phage major capsid protein|nr:phage major capsid protein [Treponema sp.]